jgi:lysophospholipid acyltransferase (LPLAT)-like uncharacterized protein
MQPETQPAGEDSLEHLPFSTSEPAKRTRRARKRAERGGGIEELRSCLYQFTDLSEYTFRDRLTIRLADLFFFVLISLICRTVRWEVEGLEHLDSIISEGHRAIYTFWHSCIFSATWFWRSRGIVVMSSKSRDGEFTGRLIKRFGYGASRGSSTRGAGRALAEMSTCLDNSIDVAFTIDGPKGPAFVAKTGAVTLARHTGHAILPFHIAPARYLELRTWDRMRIPRPFTRARVGIGRPIYVPRSASAELIASKQAELQATLDSLRNGD